MNSIELLESLKELLSDLVPKDCKYFLDFKFEDNESIQFVLVTFDASVSLFVNNSNTGILNHILPILNSRISKFKKEIVIDIEVFENYGK
ncbi:hypothetical protein SCORR_v1c07520 [Spiroplasma corruscae]|uniref:NIF system FeS cluster assembly NifU C-terminal domain-containing protein n=1 Tax=Spiroplasma corruscae TaxID=216934 RepID=A0A222EQL8_9MOLU|nr:hypothetical protein [Spiroplasma corruscae]ASP28524.1 hypothetical protein SCORR_v1c07520 [Spiroplasma corruscae]